MRQRHSNETYSLSVKTPQGKMIEFKDLYNLEHIANTINMTFFSGFDVVSRPMVSNWLYYPERSRRLFATNFDIRKITT